MFMTVLLVGIVPYGFKTATWGFSGRAAAHVGIKSLSNGAECLTLMIIRSAVPQKMSNVLAAAPVRLSFQRPGFDL